jgi:hypothetical protein
VLKEHILQFVEFLLRPKHNKIHSLNYFQIRIPKTPVQLQLFIHYEQVEDIIVAFFVVEEHFLVLFDDEANFAVFGFFGGNDASVLDEQKGSVWRDVHFSFCA